MIVENVQLRELAEVGNDLAEIVDRLIPDLEALDRPEVNRALDRWQTALFAIGKAAR